MKHYHKCWVQQKGVSFQTVFSTFRVRKFDRYSFHGHCWGKADQGTEESIFWSPLLIYKKLTKEGYIQNRIKHSRCVTRKLSEHVLLCNKLNKPQQSVTIESWNKNRKAYVSVKIAIKVVINSYNSIISHTFSSCCDTGAHFQMPTRYDNLYKRNQNRKKKKYTNSTKQHWNNQAV